MAATLRCKNKEKEGPLRALERLQAEFESEQGGLHGPLLHPSDDRRVLLDALVGDLEANRAAHVRDVESRADIGRRALLHVHPVHQIDQMSTVALAELDRNIADRLFFGHSALSLGNHLAQFGVLVQSGLESGLVSEKSGESGSDIDVGGGLGLRVHGYFPLCFYL